jgi:hypothetical protein
VNELYDLVDQYPAIPICMVLFLLFLVLMKRMGKRAQRSGRPKQGRGLLSQVVCWFSPRDPLRIFDLLRSIIILGASGSGKTSGSGYQLARAIVGMGRKISCIIFASKPEDREFWQRIFQKAGRLRDLLIFSPQSQLRCNFLDFLLRFGGGTRDITQAIMVIGETLQQGSGGGGRESEPFWRREKGRMLYNGIEIVVRATGRVTAPDLQRFINGAAQSPAALSTPEWQSGFHSKCLEAAFGNARDSIQRHDYTLAAEYWLKEYPAMNDRTRSSIIAEVMGTLHVFNTGIVRELVSTTTNFSPAVMDQGLSILVDMPISSDGAAGAFVIGGMKYLSQWYILKRHVTEKTPVCVLWSDEYQKAANSGDPLFLAECRSHRGCMICLTQSIHSLYSRIHEGGEHETDSLLTNFHHKVAHALGDDRSAAYFSGLVGKRLTTHIGGSSSPAKTVADEIFGQHPRFSASVSQHIENELENRVFMQNLRTGGEANGCIVDGIVVRSGQPFSNGKAWLKVAFRQK